jgi:hypothetical protein
MWDDILSGNEVDIIFNFLFKYIFENFIFLS